MHKKLLICVCATAALVAMGCNESKSWKKNPECGNQIIEVGEECDVVTDKLCVNYDSTKIWEDGGRPGCNSACRLTVGTCVEKNAYPSVNCGNGVLDAGEECDGSLFANAEANCVTYLGEGATGTLSCLNCKVTTTGCVASDKCGNGKIDENEKCDGKDFGGNTCDSLIDGSVGDLGCIACTTIDTTGCQVPNLCNNGEINDNEECDGADIGAATCEDRKGEGATGVVTCTSSCMLDYSQCKAATCGNNQKDENEDCDGEDFGEETCSSIIHNTEGTLSCDENCNIVTTACTPINPCGNGQIDEGEECDGEDFGEETCHTQDSMSIGGTLLCSDCRILLTNCEYFEETCGNSRPDPGEECDKAVAMEGVSCTTLNDGAIGGDLKCGDNCLYDKSSCEYETQVECGDGQIQGEEECEGNDFGGKTCANYKGKDATGHLFCNSCVIDASNCVAAPTCGDHVKNGEEECDDQDLGGALCPEGTTGTPVCKSDCTLDTSETVCVPNSCNNGVLDEGEECDPSVVSYNDIACTTPNLYSASAFAVGSISCSDTCEIVEDCTDKTAEDFTVTELFNTCYGGLLSNNMVRFADDTQKRNMTYRHELRGITWTLSEVEYSSEVPSLSLGNWWVGSDGAPNAVKYIQHELLKTTENETLANNNCEYTTLGSRIIDDFDYIAVQIDFRRVNSASPKQFAVVLYDGNEFKAVLKNFKAESFTNFNTTGEIVFSVKGMTNPIVRIQSYEAGGPMYFRNYQVRGLKVK